MSEAQTLQTEADERHFCREQPSAKINEGVSYVLSQRLKSWIHYVMTFWCESNECAEEKHTLCKLKTAGGLLRATKASHLDNIVKRSIKGKKQTLNTMLHFHRWQKKGLWWIDT